MNHAAVTNPFLYLERNAQSNPSGVFVETVDQKILSSDALVMAKQIAYELRRLGVKSGDLVALDLPEALSMIFTEAVFHEAAVSTVLPGGYASDGAFPIEWIFSSASPAPTPQGGARVIGVDATFLQRVEQNPYGITHRDFESAQSTVRLVFSSGTTGQPNGVPFSLELLEFVAADALTTFMEGEPFLGFLPTATTMGFLAFYTSAKHDRPYWSVGGGKPEDIVELALRSFATSLKASPAQIAAFIEALEARNQALPHVRTVHILGGVMPPTLAARMRAATGGCEIYNLYGSTEVTLAFARYYESDDPFDAGHPVAGTLVQIVADDDTEVPRGEIGRVRLHNPRAAHAYAGNPEATRLAFRDDWFYPGDLGLIRPDGGLTLAGRSSEVLNAGGVKVDLVQLDLFALSAPLVLDAASFGYDTTTGVQQIGIALVTKDGLDVQALIQGFTTRFGDAAPKLIVRADSIPRNAMGKPMRRTLAEHYAER